MRFWIGVAVLAALLVLGFVVMAVASGQQEALVRAAEQAREAVLARDWEQAKVWAQEARKLWEASRQTMAAFADHGPLEQMDGLFTELWLYAREALPVEFAAACGRIADLAGAIAQTQKVFWWDLL